MLSGSASLVCVFRTSKAAGAGASRAAIYRRRQSPSPAHSHSYRHQHHHPIAPRIQCTSRHHTPQQAPPADEREDGVGHSTGAPPDPPPRRFFPRIQRRRAASVPAWARYRDSSNALRTLDPAGSACANRDAGGVVGSTSNRRLSIRMARRIPPSAVPGPSCIDSVTTRPSARPALLQYRTRG